MVPPKNRLNQLPTHPRLPPGPAPAPILPFKAPSKRTWLIHVHGPTVRENKQTRLNRPLVIVRRSDRMHEMVICRAVDLLSPSRLVHHHQSPLPETEQNAVAYFESTGEIALYFDPPSVLPTNTPSFDPRTADVPEASLVRVMLSDEEWTKRAQRASHRIQR